jgi:hypothetical protein
MDKNDLEKLKIEIEKNHRANIAAIERLLGKTRETAPMVTTLVQTDRPKESLSQIVDRIIKNSDDNFSISDICRKFKAETRRNPSSNIRLLVSQAINKLRHRNPPEIDVVIEGKGSRSGIYKIRTN